jgi:hypothetical protein
MPDLPMFETVRSNTYVLLTDARDWLRTDVHDRPRGDRLNALRRAQRLIDQAKDALNDAADLGE